MDYWLLGYLKTNLSSCICVHVIPKCSALDYFYKYIPLKQPIVFDNGPCIFIQLLLQSIFSYSGEITIFPESFENKFTLLKLSKAKKEHKTQVIQAELNSWKINQPQAKNDRSMIQCDKLLALCLCIKRVYGNMFAFHIYDLKILSLYNSNTLLIVFW